MAEAGFKTIGYSEMRHTWVSANLDAGIDTWKVAGWAGHSVQVLERHYGQHIVRANEAKVADVANF